MIRCFRCGKPITHGNQYEVVGHKMICNECMSLMERSRLGIGLDISSKHLKAKFGS
jgi:hypothetical protein